MKDGVGTVVADGKTYFLTNEAGAIIGVGFEPTTAIKGAASAKLSGGPGGVQAVDGRTMGADYSWSFTLQPNEVFLPLVVR